MENNLASKYSKWRQQAVEIKAGELKEIYFDNTNPNMFFISNFNDATIYGGLNRVPTAKSHEFVFRPHKQKPFGIPLGKRVLYLLNLSDEDVTVDVYSTEMSFDLNVLQDFSVDNVTITADDPVSFKLAGVVEGMTLPTETDKETKDLLASIKEYVNGINNKTEQETLLTAIKNGIASLVALSEGEGEGEDSQTDALLTEIKTLVNTIATKEDPQTDALLTEIKNLLTESGEDGSTTNILTDIKTALTVGDIMKLPDDLGVFETKGTTANKSCQRAYFVEIMFLKNDGTSDLEVTMWQGDETQKITLKPNEELKNIQYMTNTADNGFQVGAVDSAQRSYRLIFRAKR